MLKFPQNLVLNMTNMKLPPSFYSTFSVKNHMDNGCNPADLFKNSGFANLDDLFLIKPQETTGFEEQQV